MRRTVVVAAGTVLGEDRDLSLAQLCRACGLTAEAVTAMVEEGILEPRGSRPGRWRFPPDCLGRARLVDKDVVNLIHDGIVQRPLNASRKVIGQIVAQVVKPKLVVGSVCHVGCVRLGTGNRAETRIGLSLVAGIVKIGRLLGTRLEQAYRQAHQVIDRTHPQGIAAS
jgi:hypothetical protein